MPNYCNNTGFLSFSFEDLLPHGLIKKKYVRQYPYGMFPSAVDLANPAAGVTYTQVPLIDDKGEPVKDSSGSVKLVWLEERKQLPADHFSVYFQYTTTSRSQSISLAALAQQGGGPGLGWLMNMGGGLGAVGFMLSNTLFTGGFINEQSRFIWQVISSQTIYDSPITITKDILNTGIISMPGYIVGLMGVFAQPLNLSDDQKKRIGESYGVSRVPKNGITNSITADGTWDGRSIDGGTIYGDETLAPIFPSTDTKTSREIFNEKNLVVKILRDDRVISMSTDNRDREGQIYSYTMDIRNQNPIQTKNVKINTSGFKVGDIVYITGCFANSLSFREKIQHKSTLYEPSSIAGLVLTGKESDPTHGTLIENTKVGLQPISSAMEICHYHMAKQKVMVLGPELCTADKLDKNFLDTTIADISSFVRDQAEGKYETIEGWRLSEYNCQIVPKGLYMGDSKGISIVQINDKREIVASSILINRNNINKEWYDAYLKDNGLESFIIEEGTILQESDTTGVLFDISEINNILEDKDKIPYNATLAKAIQSIGFGSGMGIPHLDLIIAAQTNSNIKQTIETNPILFDLSAAVFKTTGSTSGSTGAWTAYPCSSAGWVGSYYDPQDPLNKFNLLVPSPGGGVITDWLLATPIYEHRLDSKSRIYTELFLPEGLVFRQYSHIYVWENPILESALSFDYTYYKHESFLFFQNTNDTLAYYNFEDGTTDLQLKYMTYYPTGNHNRLPYNFNDFRIIGYNMTIGDSPSYSEGEIVCNSLIQICNYKIAWEDIFTIDNWIPYPTYFTSDKTATGNPLTSYEINIPASYLHRNIELSYEVKQDWEVGYGPSGSSKILQNGVVIGDNSISIEFVNTNMIIDNIFLPVTKGKHTILLDGRYYGGNPIRIHGDLIGRMLWNNISVIYTTKDKINNYWFDVTQTATAIDGSNLIHVFYNDQGSGNISCAVSDDMLGKYWYRYRDIIRLSKGESAEQPYTIVDKNSNVIYLFYKLNGRYLMVKEISTEWFECDDQFIEYVPPDVFDAKSNDLLNIEEYSYRGQNLRKEKSRFIHGDVTEEFVKREQNITETRRKSQVADNGSVTFVGGDKSITKSGSFRFCVPGGMSSATAATMTDIFDGSFAVYQDTSGNFRVFYVGSNGRLSIKMSSDLDNWFFIAKDVWIHKTFFDDDPQKDDITIENPQIVHDSTSGNLYLLYYHDEALYMRTFNESDLVPKEDLILYPSADGMALDDSFIAAPSIRLALEVSTNAPNRPVFLVGKITDKMAKALLEHDENLAAIIHYPVYDEKGALIFSDNFAIDTSAKTVGFVTNNGTVRLFYRTSEGLVTGITINGGLPLLDVQRRFVS